MGGLAAVRCAMAGAAPSDCGCSGSCGGGGLQSGMAAFTSRGGSRRARLFSAFGSLWKPRKDGLKGTPGRGGGSAGRRPRQRSGFALCGLLRPGSSSAKVAPVKYDYSDEVLEWLSKPEKVETVAVGRASSSGAGGSLIRDACGATADIPALRASGAAAVSRAEVLVKGSSPRFVYSQAPAPPPPPGPPPGAHFLGHDLLLMLSGGALTLALQPLLMRKKEPARKGKKDSSTQFSPKGEPVEWVNMCWRKMWRVYQRGLERWIVDLLQPVIDSLIDDLTPRPLRRLKILEFTLDHEAPTFSNMRRRNSRKDSDLTGMVDCRYTGGAKLLLQIELGINSIKTFKIPVMVSSLDFQGKLWIKLRLAPICPWIGTIFLAFVGAPRIQVQLSPYNRVPLMRIPILQKLLAKLLAEDLPGLMVLPNRIEIAIPPSVTTVAEAAVGRDAIMQAVASAVLQADTLEASLASALPLGPQGAAGGISLPEAFVGELSVILREGRALPVWGTSLQSNPWCRILLDEQAVTSKRNKETSTRSDHKNPVWNQEFQFLVQDPATALLHIDVKDSHLTGRTEVGHATLPLIQLPEDRTVTMWVPVESPVPGQPHTGGELLLELSYKTFEDEDDGGSDDSAYGTFADDGQPGRTQITDIKSAADASSRANVAQSAAMTAVAVTKAAAARAATQAARAAQAAGATTVNTTLAAANQVSKFNPLSSNESKSGKDRSDGQDGSGRRQERGARKGRPVNGATRPRPKSTKGGDLQLDTDKLERRERGPAYVPEAGRRGGSTYVQPARPPPPGGAGRMEAAPPVSLAKETAARRETMLESEAATRLLVERALHQVEAELHRLETGRDKEELPTFEVALDKVEEEGAEEGGKAEEEDRSWLMLVSGLLAVAILLLAVVAVRLGKISLGMM
mmetsp:Transcript_14128/g.36259  ORF Transcript_14128/g.36259 Transcript_14128/m.36259 type:complete len:909 (-) Transcript_14128:219-2945(-)